MMTDDDELRQRALTQSGRFHIQACILNMDDRGEHETADELRQILRETWNEYYGNYLRDVRPCSPGHAESASSEVALPESEADTGRIIHSA